MWQRLLLFHDVFTVVLSDSTDVVRERIQNRLVEPKLFRVKNPAGAFYVGRLAELDFDLHPLPRGPLATDDSKPAVHIAGRLEPSDSGTVVHVRLNLGAHMKLFFWLLYFVGLVGPFAMWSDAQLQGDLPGGMTAFFITCLMFFAVPALWGSSNLRRVRSDFEGIIAKGTGTDFS